MLITPESKYSGRRRFMRSKNAVEVQYNAVRLEKQGNFSSFCIFVLYVHVLCKQSYVNTVNAALVWPFFSSILCSGLKAAQNVDFLFSTRKTGTAISFNLSPFSLRQFPEFFGSLRRRSHYVVGSNRPFHAPLPRGIVWNDLMVNRFQGGSLFGT